MPMLLLIVFLFALIGVLLIAALDGTSPRVTIQKSATAVSKEIRNLDVQFISLVGKAANKRTVVYKGQKGEPGSTADGAQAIDRIIDIRKVDQEKRLVYGIVYAPDELDTEQHTMTAAEIEKAAHAFMAAGRTGQVDKDHDEDPDEGFVVESYLISKGDLRFPNDPEGSWAVVIKVTSDDTWNEVKKGDISGISMQGTCNLVDTAKKGLFDRFTRAIKSMRESVSKDFNDKMKVKHITSGAWTLANAIEEIVYNADITDKVAAVKESVQQYLDFIEAQPVTKSTTMNGTQQPAAGDKPEGTADEKQGLEALKKSVTDLQEQLQKATKANEELTKKVDELEKAAPVRKSEDATRETETKPKTIGLLGLE